ncbi:MAG TPA: energy-coupling factor transporter ATPase [Lachnospiraceae bacterium]|jgi:energy-coupling factor transport system ATP-binding protein|nr:energy-coupling factor transporter ATPase [Lachnospiraceae bacterium]
MDEMIRSVDLAYRYEQDEDENESDTQSAVKDPVYALNGVNVTISKGEFVVILGHNGSGKSTFARHINALLQPQEGSMLIEGMDTREEANLWTIRQKAGMIFQNPDNQMIASIVEDDVAFGPENIGLPPKQIRENVDDSLKAVGMEKYRLSSPQHLSGGQKQRIAIASILAMTPECIVLDEPTAMLDPKGRRDVMDTLIKLNKERHMTVVHITHYMEEAVEADRVIVMDHGKVVMEGTPRQIFVRVEEMKALGLDVPPMTELAWRLRKDGFDIPADILTVEEMTNALCQLKSKM